MLKRCVMLAALATVLAPVAASATGCLHRISDSFSTGSTGLAPSPRCEPGRSSSDLRRDHRLDGGPASSGLGDFTFTDFFAL